jgi:hypothetical protein
MADAPDYYVLGVEDPEVGYRARLIYERDQPLRSWMSGRPFESPPPEPIVLELRGTDEADWVLGDLWLTPITVMSKRLLEAVQGAGVSNLETYAVELHDPVSGQVHTDFVAFNLVDAVSLADLAKARSASNGQGEASDRDASGVRVAQLRPPLMFRLAESLNAILIHESVCDAIEDAGIDTLTFYEPDDWAG